LFQRVMGWGMVLRSAGKPRQLWFISINLLVLNTVFSWILTTRLGIVGAALGTLIATALNLILTLHLFTRVFQTSWRGVFPWASYGLILAVSLSAAVGARLAASSAPSVHLHLIIEVIVYVLIAFLGIRAFGVFKRLPSVPDDTPEMTRIFEHTPSTSR
jgi:Na+-driven multidrug efflux pump